MESDSPPLILRTQDHSKPGKRFASFLEGRVDGDKYALILRLTNMELKGL